MSEYIVQRNSLVNVADEIRTLSGTTAEMGLDVMATHVGEANDEIISQEELIAQLNAALEGKGASTIAYTVHIGSSVPTTDIGVDGDIYIKREASA